jgi:hypothetical protein
MNVPTDRHCRSCRGAAKISGFFSIWDGSALGILYLWSAAARRRFLSLSVECGGSTPLSFFGD